MRPTEESYAQEYAYTNATQNRMMGSDVSLMKANSYPAKSKWPPGQTPPYKGNHYDQYGEYQYSRGTYDTPASLINKMNEQPHDIAQEFLDMEMHLKERRPFTRDDFRQMISKTYLEYYGKFKD